MELKYYHSNREKSTKLKSIKSATSEVHSFYIIFQSPFLDDTLKLNKKGTFKKGYKIIKRQKDITIELDSSHKRQKKVVYYNITL